MWGEQMQAPTHRKQGSRRGGGACNLSAQHHTASISLLFALYTPHLFLLPPLSFNTPLEKARNFEHLLTVTVTVEAKGAQKAGISA